MTYTRESLKMTNIYMLRLIGRELGVKSVTNLIKAELIEEILAVSRGEKEPHHSKVGRPTMKGYYMKDKTVVETKIEPKNEKTKEEMQMERELDAILKQFKSFILKYAKK